MIKTTKMLLEELSDYANPYSKIRQLIKDKKLFPIVKGLYETDQKTNGLYLSQAIYGPSYLSFDYALSYYGLIPEAVYTFTSATYEKRKSKLYCTIFGNFAYRDVPKSVYHYGIKIVEENGYHFLIATKEKALCDKLYSLKPLKNQKELEYLLFNDLRIDEDEFNKLNKDDIFFIANEYKNTNVELLSKYLKRRVNSGLNNQWNA